MTGDMNIDTSSYDEALDEQNHNLTVHLEVSRACQIQERICLGLDDILDGLSKIHHQES